jgi:methyl-accepting chemotaxis protein
MMLNRLSIKLLLPSFITGILTILLVLIFADTMSKTSMVLSLIVMILAQLIAGFFYSQQKLSQRIVKLKEYLDLVVSVEQAPSAPLVDNNGDDLGEVINELSDFIDSLAVVIAEIREESDILRNGSQNLTEKMSESVQSVDESANQINQMAQSIEHVASTSAVLSESAVQVSETTKQVLSILSQGTLSSNTSQQTIESVAHEVNGTASDLALLQDECARIGSVLDVIRGIADQTNLLALNAAIEAARAGEQGRGFAVVADEVRALAHRTQESTVEIQSMVEGLQEKSTNAVNAIGRGQTLTQESLSHSAEVVDALKKIGSAFKEVDTLTGQIANSTGEQQQSTSSINDNMSAVVALSQNINAGLVSVSEHAEKQHQTAEQVDVTLNRICV